MRMLGVLVLLLFLMVMTRIALLVIISPVERIVLCSGLIVGVLSFHSAPDYEKPSDTGRNNIYVLDVTVTSGNGVRERSATEKITVRVRNVDEQDAENSTGNYSGGTSCQAVR